MDSSKLPTGGLGTRASLTLLMPELGREAGEPVTPWHPLGGWGCDHHGGEGCRLLSGEGAQKGFQYHLGLTKAGIQIVVNGIEGRPAHAGLLRDTFGEVGGGAIELAVQLLDRAGEDAQFVEEA